MTAEFRNEGHATGVVRRVLRLEGAAALGIGILLYRQSGGEWGWLALTFFAPDLSLLGYLGGRRVGAIAYNAAHSYAGPALLFLAAVLSGENVARLGALIWVAHIGFDRMLGYGLKYATAFTDTHLGPIGIGRKAPAVASQNQGGHA
jgi:hypothetical protein